MALPASAEVVVVGGGIMGASALYYLAKAGCRDCVLVERETLAAGSTSKAAGGIRAQFSDELNVRIALECISRYRNFSEQPGGEIDFKQWGYLFLLTTEGEVASFTRSVELQQRLGVPSRLIGADEARRSSPGCASTTSSRRRSARSTATRRRRPRRRATQPPPPPSGRRRPGLQRGADRRRAGRVGVDTSQGRVATGRVILTAGVWSKELGATAGVTIPVEPERRHVFFTEPGDTLPLELPLTIDFATGFYFHREGRGLLFGGREQSLEELAPIAAGRLPPLGELSVRGGWWGYYEVSPDHNALVGATSEPEGLVYATGFSGHGFQQAPVIGEHVALLALGLPTPFDLGPFGLERFDDGVSRPELNVV